MVKRKVEKDPKTITVTIQSSAPEGRETVVTVTKSNKDNEVHVLKKSGDKIVLELDTFQQLGVADRDVVGTTSYK